MERGGPLELPEWPVDWTIHDVPSKEHNELAVMGLGYGHEVCPDGHCEHWRPDK